MVEPWSIDTVRTNPDAFAALTELLWQLADDDLVVGFRDQEWLGLAPHIEEDVAFGSIGQEEIGHAAHYYGILAELGLGAADDLASLRGPEERRNSVLLEMPNGTGHYLNDPRFDWAWTIVRHYFHDLWEMACLEELRASRFLPLSNAAVKIIGEKRYHRAHQELWLRTMASHDESRPRLDAALEKAGAFGGDLDQFGVIAGDLRVFGLMPDPEAARERFHGQSQAFLESLGLRVPAWKQPMNGRLGHHTEELTLALATLSEVYRLDPSAQW